MTAIRLVFFNYCGCGCNCGGTNGDFDGDILLIMDIEYLDLLVCCPSFLVAFCFH